MLVNETDGQKTGLTDLRADRKKEHTDRGMDRWEHRQEMANKGLPDDGQITR